jgi:biopolymer transport protein ExbD
MALNQFFQNQEESLPEISLSPMIDMVFLLLLFFIVTTTFNRDEAIEIKKSEAKSAAIIDREKIKVLVDSTGNYWLEEEIVAMDKLVTTIKQWNSLNPQGAILIVPDKRGQMDPFIQLLDALNLAKIRNFAIATTSHQDKSDNNSPF